MEKIKVNSNDWGVRKLQEIVNILIEEIETIKKRIENPVSTVDKTSQNATNQDETIEIPQKQFAFQKKKKQ